MVVIVTLHLRPPSQQTPQTLGKATHLPQNFMLSESFWGDDNNGDDNS